MAVKIHMGVCPECGFKNWPFFDLPYCGRCGFLKPEIQEPTAVRPSAGRLVPVAYGRWVRAVRPPTWHFQQFKRTFCGRTLEVAESTECAADMPEPRCQVCERELSWGPLMEETDWDAEWAARRTRA